jgi:serpin B
MMTRIASFGHYSSVDGFRIIQLPFEGGSVVMNVILPDKEIPLEKFEKDFTRANLDTWLGKLREKRVLLKLPRFKATGGFTDLKPVFVSLGMPAAFDRQADFSGISSGKGITVSVLAHKAVVEANERGVTAAAASSVGFAPSPIERQDTDFIADRPFIFLLRDTASKLILFMGRVTEPEQIKG